jgi:hypothetical protein
MTTGRAQSRRRRSIARGSLGGSSGTETRDEAGDGIRTHDNHVGNVVLYQLSYTRTSLFRTTNPPPWRRRSTVKKTAGL